MAQIDFSAAAREGAFTIAPTDKLTSGHLTQNNAYRKATRAIYRPYLSLPAAH
jgi:hypothetical protein